MQAITAPVRAIWRPVGAFLNHKRVVPLVFLAPYLTVFGLFKLYPVIRAVIMSFQDFQGVKSQEWVGLENYENVFNLVRFEQALSNTTWYTVGTIAILIPLPLILAVLLNSGYVYQSTFFRTALFLPALTSLVVAGTVFSLILARRGFLNAVLQTTGMQPVRWLELAEYALPSLILVATWRWTGINILYFNAGLVNIPKELYEAAAIDGARPHQTFFRITLPLLRPTTFFVIVLSIIGGYQVFVEPFILYTGGSGPGDGGLTLALLIYRTAFTSFDFGTAAAMGVVLAGIIFVFSLIQFRFFGVLKKED
ncbi:MAG: sugar ABC transporter permease [Chloroflexi bacterium]|jgi:arabinosaccharide transport system permease protein|nr:sugar ABC transporter permease [Chloroflexota bacterium]